MWCKPGFRHSVQPVQTPVNPSPMTFLAMIGMQLGGKTERDGLLRREKPFLPTGKTLQV
jgi:hypothetical protein